LFRRDWPECRVRLGSHREHLTGSGGGRPGDKEPSPIAPKSSRRLYMFSS
jgi:hypothetical protein